MQVADLQKMAAKQLSAVSQSASLDAQVLLAHVLGISRSWILAHPDAETSPDQEKALLADLERMEAGEALPYILGHWEFFGLDFILTPDVLIPRPETELLVGRALNWLNAHPSQRRLADIGTGSGCIAISLALNLLDLAVVATDIAPAALEVARANAVNHHVSDRLQFIRADLFDFQPSILQPFDVILANLPYIPSARLKSLDVARREPISALDGGVDGLSLVRRLLQKAPAALAPGGLILMEIDSSHAAAACALAKASFPLAQVDIHRDLAGHDRLVEIQLA